LSSEKEKVIDKTPSEKIEIKLPLADSQKEVSPNTSEKAVKGSHIKEIKEKAVVVQKSTSASTIPFVLFGKDENNLMSGWMKLRNYMKNWKQRWFILRKGKLIYYKDDKRAKKDQCTGILQLADCKVEERATHKNGFSFKIKNIYNYPIYQSKGLKGESIKSARVPVGWTYSMLLVSSESERKAWMTAIKEQIANASILLRNNSGNENPPKTLDITSASDDEDDLSTSPKVPKSPLIKSDEDDEEKTKKRQKRIIEDQKILITAITLHQQRSQRLTEKMIKKLKTDMEARIAQTEKKIITCYT